MAAVTLGWVGPPLSLAEYDVLWHCHHGEDVLKPLVLDTPSEGATYERRSGLESQAWEALRRKGYVTGNRIEDGVGALLDVLRSPQVELDLRWQGPSMPQRALAVRAGHVALLAVLRADRLWLRRIDPSGLAGALVALLPRWAPAQIRSESAPVRAVETANERLRRRARQAVDQPYGEIMDALGAEFRSVQARELFTAVAADRSGERGEFGAAARVRGVRHRGDHSVTVVDATFGRCLVVRRDGFVTIAGGDDGKIIGSLCAAVDAVSVR